MKWGRKEERALRIRDDFLGKVIGWGEIFVIILVC